MNSDFQFSTSNLIYSDNYLTTYLFGDFNHDKKVDIVTSKWGGQVMRSSSIKARLV